VIVLAVVARNGRRVPMALRVLGTASATSGVWTGWAGGETGDGGASEGKSRAAPRCAWAGRGCRRWQKPVEDAMHYITLHCCRQHGAASSAVHPTTSRSLPWCRLRVKAITSGRGVTCSKHSPTALIRLLDHFSRLLMGHAICICLWRTPY
jgi:hypothetical protein